MGAFAPVPWVTEELMGTIRRTIIEPTLRGMVENGAPFKGCLYCGLMITNQGPKVLEYNIRFGDPEIHPVFDLLLNDVLSLLLGSTNGTLPTNPLSLSGGYAVTVVLASRGYPGKCDTGYPITGIEAANSTHTFVAHAGTAKNPDGQIINASGRVLDVTGGGDTLQEAIDWAYQACDRISFPGCWYRHDIAKKAL